MKNLELYNSVRKAPAEALTQINAGRLKGKSDINPMWRIKTLTELFGVVGFGWYYDITKKWIEDGANGEKVAFVDINLYVKQNGEWSKPIQGTGGSSFVSKEKAGLYTNDECIKMALTDAISVCCKALGIGADVYWAKDKTKYTLIKKDTITNEQVEIIKKIIGDNKDVGNKIIGKKYNYKNLADIDKSDFQKIIKDVEAEINLLKNRKVS